MRCKHPSEDDVEMLVSGVSAYIYPVYAELSGAPYIWL